MVTKEEMQGVLNAEPEKFAFINTQKVDADAAYQRMAITRQTLNGFKESIEKTNTADITPMLKGLYVSVVETLEMIVSMEHQLILEGE